MGRDNWNGNPDAVCMGKESFKSPAAAAKAKKGLAKRRNAKPHLDLQVYRCPYCSSWHLGGKSRMSVQTMHHQRKVIQRKMARYARVDSRVARPENG